MSIFRSITLMLLFLTAVPVIIVGLILIGSTVDIVKTLTWELQQERVERAGQQVKAYVDNIIDDLDLLVTNLGVAQMNVNEQQKLLAFILQKRPEVNVIGFYDDRGQPQRNLLAFDSARILPSELADHQRTIATIPVERARSRSLAFSAPYRIDRPARVDLEIPARREMAVATLLRIGGGDAAYLGLELSLDPLQRIIASLRRSPRGHMVLVGGDLAPIAQSSGEQTSGQEMERIAAQLPGMVGGGPAGSGALRVSGARPVKLSGGREMLVAYSPLVQPDWRMIALEPLDDAYAATRRMTWQVFWVVGVSLLAAIALGIVFVFTLTRPIAKLVHGSLAIARGNFGTELDVRAHNELGELAHTFNYMSSQLLYYDRQNQSLLESLERGYLETLRALANSIDAKDPYTAGHSGRVTDIALAIGHDLELSEEELKTLRYAGILHDIGKIGIPEEILGKKGRLTEAELQHMRLHPVLGERIIQPIDFLQVVRPLVRHHHEWVDGTGYPDGLKGDEIPLGARIIAAADTYDAITSDRPYQAAVQDEEAIQILERLRSRQFDPRVCDAVVRVIRNKTREEETPPTA